MADIEAKLNMSLEDLAKKKHQQERQKKQQQEQRQQAQHKAGQQQQQQMQMQQQMQQRNGGGGWAQQRQRPGQGPPQQQQGGAWGGQQQQGGAWGAQHQQGGWAFQQQGGPWGGQQQQMQQPQGGWGPGGGGGGGQPQRRSSVFSRLSGVPAAGGPPQRVQQQPARQQQARPQQPQLQPAQQPQPQRPQQQQGAKKPKLHCRLDPESGLVVITSSGGIDIVKAGPAGDITLSNGGDSSQDTLEALNAALAPLNMSVKAAGDAAAAAWSVSDGKGLQRFRDGMRLPAKGPLTAGRPMVLMQAFASGKDVAAAAQQASTQAAIAAGLLPADAAAKGPPGGAESGEDARMRRLKAQGRYQPY